MTLNRLNIGLLINDNQPHTRVLSMFISWSLNMMMDIYVGDDPQHSNGQKCRLLDQIAQYTRTLQSASMNDKIIKTLSFVK